MKLRTFDGQEQRATWSWPKLSARINHPLPQPEHSLQRTVKAPPPKIRWMNLSLLQPRGLLPLIPTLIKFKVEFGNAEVIDDSRNQHMRRIDHNRPHRRRSSELVYNPLDFGLKGDVAIVIRETVRGVHEGVTVVEIDEEDVKREGKDFFDVARDCERWEGSSSEHKSRRGNETDQVAALQVFFGSYGPES